MSRAQKTALIALLLLMVLVLLWWILRPAAPEPDVTARAASASPAASPARPSPASPRPAPRPRSAARQAMVGAADPLRALLTAEDTRSAVVVELNALLHAPLAEAALPCFDLQPGGARRAALEAVLGEGALERFDRLAISDGLIVLTGQVPAAAQHLPAGQPYGERGRLFGDTVAVWGDGVVLGSPDPARLRAALDRLEGRGAAGTPLFTDEASAQDVYAVLSGPLLDAARAGLAPEQQAALSGVTAARLTVRAGDALEPEVTLEGGALEPLRAAAQRWLDGRAEVKAEGPPDRGVPEVLGGARLAIEDGALRARLTVPQELVARRLRSCTLGLERAPQDPRYPPLARPAVEGWDVPMLPGFVSARTHEAALLSDWKQYGQVLALEKQLGGGNERFVDPLTLDTLTFSRTTPTKPGVCARMVPLYEQWMVTPAVEGMVVTKAEIGGRTWYRQVSALPDVRTIEYFTCAGDTAWRMSVGITGPALSTALAVQRLDAYLAGARLE